MRSRVEEDEPGVFAGRAGSRCGLGVHSVLECVSLEQAMLTALSIARPGGAAGRVGVPQDQSIPAGDVAFFDNVSVSGGPAPVRAYIEELLPDVLDGRIEPGPRIRSGGRPRRGA